ncbi:probable galacturonosyltransferase 11 [Punica granatum]|uniref:Hexosyltransferase n=2 Tax=Punica granatum TaxID=22663 RepID=A0A6P8BZ73_PUNGR|nr:probable galacturonosyltransferase 11 [Punica granatum]
MRRRAADFRRSGRRRWSTRWIWALLGLFFVAGCILFVVHHNHHEGRAAQLVMENSVSKRREAHSSSKFTDEVVSATSFSQQLSEQIILAKAYVVIAKEHNDLHLAWELSSKIRSSQLLLSKAAMRGEIISLAEAESLMKSLSSLFLKAQDLHYDIATTIVTMKSHMQALEQRASSSTVQSIVSGRLVAESVPRSLHCLNLKLIADWLKDPPLKRIKNGRQSSNSARLVDNSLHHFCLFSDNVLAASVVVNSTVSNSNSPKDLVFHIVTDSINYGAMLSWFNGNNFSGSTIEVRNVRELSWVNASFSPVVGPGDVKDELPKLQDPKDTSLLNHLRFYTAEIYPELEKVVFLDDDVVVQKDLSLLFSLDLHGNVNGAVETCLESFHRYYKYINFSNPVVSSKIDPQACGWAFGMNIFNLAEWRRADITAQYLYWLELNSDRTVWRSGTLPVGLLAFYGLTEPLDRRWHVLGLGHDVNIDDRLIDSAAVIHFNGNLKPWLEIGISRYKPLWWRYVDHTHPYLRECTAN